jgi:hypothetical protein
LDFGDDDLASSGGEDPRRRPEGSGAVEEHQQADQYDRRQPERPAAPRAGAHRRLVHGTRADGPATGRARFHAP